MHLTVAAYRPLTRSACLLTGLAAALTSGCAISHPKGPHGPACVQIESATHIVDHPIQRFRIYKQIAARPTLSQHEQTYLVNAIFQPLAGGFGRDQAAASILLIHNPCCTATTRDQIREQLRHTKILGQEARHILAALDKAEGGTQSAVIPSGAQRSEESGRTVGGAPASQSSSPRKP